MLRSAVADVESNVDVFTDAILLKAVGLAPAVFASSSAIDTPLTVAAVAIDNGEPTTIDGTSAPFLTVRSSSEAVFKLRS